MRYVIQKEFKYYSFFHNDINNEVNIHFLKVRCGARSFSLCVSAIRGAQLSVLVEGGSGGAVIPRDGTVSIYTGSGSETIILLFMIELASTRDAQTSRLIG